jgi:hypothetical protein
MRPGRHDARDLLDAQNPMHGCCHRSSANTVSSRLRTTCSTPEAVVTSATAATPKTCSILGYQRHVDHLLDASGRGLHFLAVNATWF